MVKGGTENYYNYNVGTGPVYKWDNSLREMKLWKAWTFLHNFICQISSERLRNYTKPAKTPDIQRLDYLARERFL